MNVQEVASASFVLLQADWPVGKARRAVDGLWEATHIIVHRRDKHDEYHLLTSEEAVQRMSRAAAETPLWRALALRTHDAAALVEVHADAEAIPDRCVVHEQGRVIGFFDATVPPPRRGFPTRGAAEERPRGRPGSRSLVAEFP